MPEHGGLSSFMATHIFVSVAREVDEGLLVLHVDGDTPYLLQHILEVAEVCQQVHDGVANLIENWLAVANAHQGTGVVWRK